MLAVCLDLGLESVFTNHISVKPTINAIDVVLSSRRLEVSKHRYDDHLPRMLENIQNTNRVIGSNHLFKLSANVHEVYYIQ